MACVCGVCVVCVCVKCGVCGVCVCVLWCVCVCGLCGVCVCVCLIVGDLETSKVLLGKDSPQIGHYYCPQHVTENKKCAFSNRCAVILK